MRTSRSKKTLDHYYTLDKEILQQVSHSPYLGVTLSDNMKFDEHINKITKKANSSLGFIRRNLKYCPTSLKQTAYTALVRSILEYSDSVWDPYHQKDIDKLEAVQRRAVRFISNDYGRKSSVTTMMEKLQLTPLVDRRREHRITMMYRIINGLVAIPLEQFTERNSSRTRHNHSKTLKIIRTNSDIYKNSFFPRTSKDWNNLSDTIVNIDNLDTFKTSVTLKSY